MPRFPELRPINLLDNVLRDHGFRYTRQRALVHQMLGWTGPCTISQLARQLRGRVSQRSVYDAIRALRKAGAILALPDRRFEQAHPFRFKHFHVTCPGCGRIADRYDEGIEQAIKRWSHRNNRPVAPGVLELEGWCYLCRHNGQDQLALARTR